MGKNAFTERMADKKEAIAAHVASNFTTVLDINLIDENPRNEFIFNMDGVSELAEYIKEEGFYQPILVYKKEDGRYEIIAGHRKFRAKKLNGDKNIEAVIKSAPKSEGDKIHRVIFDNMHARTLSNLDMARAINEIKTVWIPEQREKGTITGNTKDILANKFKKSSSAISRYLRLLELSPELQAHLEDGKISMDAALVLRQTENTSIEGLQEFVSNMIEKHYDSLDPCENVEELNKTDIEKMVTNFKKMMPGSNPSPESAVKNIVITRKKLMKSVDTFKNILSADYDKEFKLDADDVDSLKQLKDDIERLLSQFEDEE